jgi:hypothetical protein
VRPRRWRGDFQNEGDGPPPSVDLAAQSPRWDAYTQSRRARTLALLSPSPVVELNRFAAVGLVSGPEAGLALLAPLLGDSRLEGYQPPLHAAGAELSRRSGDIAGAADAYRRAIPLSSNAVERAELERRRLALAAKPDAIAAARTAGAVAASRAPKRCSRHWPLSHCLAQAR